VGDETYRVGVPMITPSTALKSFGVITGYLDLKVPEACIFPKISSERVSRLSNQLRVCVFTDMRRGLRGVPRQQRKSTYKT
jgi:hypothetical protein